MSYNHTYAQIKDILKSSKKMTKEKMLEIAKLAMSKLWVQKCQRAQKLHGIVS